ncbi:hypothetical protein SAMN05216249_11231 [Acetitomaculum ruminis DSM 5522]|uniref:Uncharacterized protein n=1 Tax=Acetitomaculum ruminis DSM 5522 TaxID=1120918 RepID=A0A1I0YZ25_9FIRM|nr:hypothetical protein [Acetitomaculum ruminis]SFB18689.1 hypothetical protein SAMN05216249_11231 [Acetitomaculum ruminis DSM 5522]
MFKKKSLIILTLIMTVSFSNVSFASGRCDEVNKQNAIVKAANGVQLISTTVKDKDGNKYTVYGSSGASGKTATIRTEYDVTYIGDGKSSKKVYGYTKTLGAKASVCMSGGAKNTLGKTGVKKSGKSNYYQPSTKYMYNVTSITTGHSFSCNGKSYSGSTSWY